MGAKRVQQYVGILSGTGTPVSSSAQCIVYDHTRQAIYASADKPEVATDIAYAQQRWDKLGDYRVYQFIGDAWCEVGVGMGRRPRSTVSPPPMFFLWWCNAWVTTAFSFLL